MTDAKLTWPDPNCSKGYPNADMDHHMWRPPQGVDRTASWVPYRTCSFCGSMHPEDLLKVLEDERSVCMSVEDYDKALRAGPLEQIKSRLPEITLEWADFKYGGPHKLYVYHNDQSHAWGKFYVKHLLELADREFEIVSQALGAKTMIFFERDNIGTKWRRLSSKGRN